MRKAHEFVEEYRKKGYPDDRIKIIASMRPEPLRSEVLRALSEKTADTAPSEMKKVDKAAAPQVEAVEEQSAAPAEDTPASVEKTQPAAVEQSKKSAEDPQPEPQGKIEKAQDKRAMKESQKTEPDDSKESASAKKKEADMIADHEKRVSELRKEQEKLKADMDKQVATLQANLEKASAQLKQKESEIATLNKNLAETDKLRGKAKSAEKLEQETAALRAQHEEIAKAKTKIEAVLSQRETLLAEKEDEIAQLTASLAEERAAHNAAAAQSSELSDTVERQAEKLRDFGAVQEQVEEFRETLTGLKEETSLLRESEQSKAARIAELESTVTRAQEEASQLQDQLTANEQALDDLQQTLASRESELESIRAHFDLEAQDLKKRADQEVRMVQRRVRRVQKLAAIGTALAACVIIALTIGLFAGGGNESGNRVAEETQNTPTEVAGQDTMVPPNITENVTPPDVETARTPTSPRRGHGVFPANIGTEDQPPAITPSTPTSPRSPGTTPTRTTPGTKVITYTVKSGDSLWLIAKQKLDDGEKWKNIARENNISISNPSITPGDVLKITVPE